MANLALDRNVMFPATSRRSSLEGLADGGSCLRRKSEIGSQPRRASRYETAASRWDALSNVSVRASVNRFYHG